MGDLISRSQVLKEIETWGGCVEALHEYIANMPTAYDIDKVVEELEEIINPKEMYFCRVSKGRCIHNEDDIECIDCVAQRAIKIVKQGGVADDVCEWKYTKEIMDNAEFKVGCNQNALKRGIVPNNFSYHDFKYCPYCGKKIKVVE